jgi:hypothetical protein
MCDAVLRVAADHPSPAHVLPPALWGGSPCGRRSFSRGLRKRQLPAFFVDDRAATMQRCAVD